MKITWHEQDVIGICDWFWRVINCWKCRNSSFEFQMSTFDIDILHFTFIINKDTLSHTKSILEHIDIRSSASFQNILITLKREFRYPINKFLYHIIQENQNNCWAVVWWCLSFFPLSKNLNNVTTTNDCFFFSSFFLLSVSMKYI